MRRKRRTPTKPPKTTKGNAYIADNIAIKFDLIVVCKAIVSLGATNPNSTAPAAISGSGCANFASLPLAWACRGSAIFAPTTSAALTFSTAVTLKAIGWLRTVVYSSLTGLKYENASGGISVTRSDFTRTGTVNRLIWVFCAPSMFSPIGASFETPNNCSLSPASTSDGNINPSSELGDEISIVSMIGSPALTIVRSARTEIA